MNLTKEAMADIQNIYDHIEQDSPQNAAKVVREILAGADSLSFMPTRFRQVGKSISRGSPVHAVVIRPFILYYRIEHHSRVLFVLSIYHGRQQQPQRFQ
ncbi:MAG TPA: type II toxin-antitoxin system RelE/ParE family toxin [Tepidisphaeraceae bacterium]|nr:type II toxin-antitoxin system RelE/ParE family toxin [Tepidisphaeraceae bacterium]